MTIKVIGTDTDRSGNCDFLLTFHIIHGIIFLPFSFQYVAKYWPKFANFSEATFISRCRLTGYFFGSPDTAVRGSRRVSRRLISGHTCVAKVQ